MPPGKVGNSYILPYPKKNPHLLSFQSKHRAQNPKNPMYMTFCIISILNIKVKRNPTVFDS